MARTYTEEDKKRISEQAKRLGYGKWMTGRKRGPAKKFIERAEKVREEAVKTLEKSAPVADLRGDIKENIFDVDARLKKVKKEKPKFFIPEDRFTPLIPTDDFSPADIKEPDIESPVYVSSGIDKKKFIEGEFTVINKDNKEVPFKFNPVQDKYYKILQKEYPKMEGVREILLKARQEGFSTFVLALFAVDFITVPNSVSICVSQNKGDTEKLFRKVHHYIESYCRNNGFKVEDYLSVDTKQELQNSTNKALFYVRTAGSKIGGRGGTALNIHYSEAGFFETTEKITAQEIIEATNQQVPMGKGMIFMESTGGNTGTYFQLEWERAKEGTSVYKPRFFSWEEFYNDAFIEKKRLEYQTEEKFLTDYPRTDEEAFLASGFKYFDKETLRWMKEHTIVDPIQSGRLANDGEWI